MRILLISPIYPPQATVASLRVHAFARTWVESGARVTVLTTAKRADQGGFDLPPSGADVVEIPFDVPAPLEALRRVERRASSDTGPARRARGVRRWLRELRAATGVFGSLRMPDLTDWWMRPALEWCEETDYDWDVAVSSGGPYTAHLVALDLKRSGRVARWVADYRDYWTDHPSMRGFPPFTVRERSLEAQCLAAADLVTTVSEGLARTLRRRTYARVEVVRNGFGAHDLDDLDGEPIFPDDDHVRLVYTGTLYPASQRPAPLLAALAGLRERDRAVAERLRLVVAGYADDRWIRAAEEWGVRDLLDPHGVVPRDVALRMQRDADALLSVAAPSAHGVMTTKVFEYLRMSAPIMVVGNDDDDEIAALVRATGRGAAYGRHVAAIEAALRTLVAGAPLVEGERDDEAIAEYRRDRQAARMLASMRAMVAGATAIGAPEGAVTA